MIKIVRETWGNRLRQSLVAAMSAIAVFAVSACTNTKKAEKAPAHINNETKFSSKEFGVEGSPRVTTSKRVKKGGGRYQVGKPYTIRGKKYYPRLDPNYSKVGMASWYGPNFHGRLTANGEIYDQYSLSAAHPTMPLPSYARVTNLKNNSSVIVRVNDRGPFAHGRIIDLSARASELLDFQSAGVAKVKVEYVGKARMDGLDEQYLLASYSGNSLSPTGIPQLPGTGTLLAQAPVPRESLAEIQTHNVIGAGPVNVPVPLDRPTLYNGIPVEIAGGGPKNGLYGLLQGYADEKGSAVETMFQSVLREQDRHGSSSKASAPTLGMKDLVHITFGPFDDPRMAGIVEKNLADHGIVERIKSAKGEAILLITAQETAVRAIQKISNIQN